MVKNFAGVALAGLIVAAGVSSMAYARGQDHAVVASATVVSSSASVERVVQPHGLQLAQATKADPDNVGRAQGLDNDGDRDGVDEANEMNEANEGNEATENNTPR